MIRRAWRDHERSPSMMAKPTALVVGHRPPAIEETVRSLQSAGFAVHLAASPAEATVMVDGLGSPLDVLVLERSVGEAQAEELVALIQGKGHWPRLAGPSLEDPTWGPWTQPGSSPVSRSDQSTGPSVIRRWSCSNVQRLPERKCS